MRRTDWGSLTQSRTRNEIRSQEIFSTFVGNVKRINTKKIAKQNWKVTQKKKAKIYQQWQEKQVKRIITKN